MNGQDCFTCAVVSGAATPGYVVYRSALVILSHYHEGLGEPQRPGWLIACPVRHLCRWFEMTDAERDELARVSAAADRALADALGSKRTMVASLGWYTDDHLHVHLAPTVTEPVTFGWENFGADRYRALASSSLEAADAVRSSMARDATVCAAFLRASPVQAVCLEGCGRSVCTGWPRGAVLVLCTGRAERRWRPCGGGWSAIPVRRGEGLTPLRRPCPRRIRVGRCAFVSPREG